MRSVVFVERLEFEFPGNVFPNAVVLGDVDNDDLDPVAESSHVSASLMTSPKTPVLTDEEPMEISLSPLPHTPPQPVFVPRCPSSPLSPSWRHPDIPFAVPEPMEEVSIEDAVVDGSDLSDYGGETEYVVIKSSTQRCRPKLVDSKGYSYVWRKDCTGSTHWRKNELVVANVEGELNVFKGSNTSPWASCSNLGMITCIGIGDICSSKKNCLVTISAEGLCNVFSIDPTIQTEEHKKGISLNPIKLSPCHTQHLPANIKSVLIEDIDGDGKMEFVVGQTDRVVRAYRWVEKQPSTANETNSAFTSGKVVLLQKWQLNGQIGSLSLSHHPDGRPKLVVSQPGCNYAELLCSWVKGQKEEVASGANCKGETYVKWHPISNKRARNANVTTELVGRIRLSAENTDELVPYRMAMCTLDGTLMMLEEDKILWSLLVDHQLFSLTKFDINCDGHDEVVVCAWDGQTYIVSQCQESVRFHFQENVCAFCAGQYSTTGSNRPCLVYATFNKRIYLYWNVQLPRIPSVDLQQTLSENETVQQKLKELNIDTNDTRKLRELYQWCFYGNHAKNKAEDKT